MSAPPAPSPPAPWQVAVALPIPALDFAAPHGYGGAVPVGCRVLVPWRGELAVGLVVGEGDPARAHRLREAVHVLDGEEGPWVPPATVAAVTAWAGDAHLPAGLVWCDLIGVGWEARVRHRVRAVADADLSAFGRHVPPPSGRTRAGFPPSFSMPSANRGCWKRTSPRSPDCARWSAPERWTGCPSRRGPRPSCVPFPHRPRA